MLEKTREVGFPLHCSRNNHRSPSSISLTTVPCAAQGQCLALLASSRATASAYTVDKSVGGLAGVKVVPQGGERASMSACIASRPQRLGQHQLDK